MIFWYSLTCMNNCAPQALTKDHELGLKKQQEDVNSLSRHLDHVISFTKWATASHSGTALLYCKRLVSFYERVTEAYDAFIALVTL